MNVPVRERKGKRGPSLSEEEIYRLTVGGKCKRQRETERERERERESQRVRERESQPERESQREIDR